MKNTNTHFANRSAKTLWMRVSLASTMFAFSALLAGVANAGVDVTQITRGDVSFSQDGNRLIVRASNGSIIEYSRFSIEAGQIMQFIQPSSTSTVLNRVTGAELSRIDGTLLSNGIVYLVNPQGFRIGNGALINVGGFYAAAGAMSDNDFVQGRDNFTNLSGKVINEGTIQAKSVALVGQYVANRGTINVDNGMVAMAAGDTVYLQNGSGPIMVTVSRSQMGADGSGAGTQAAVSNTGTINAGSGSVAMASGDFYALAMDLSGTIIGKCIAARGGAGGVVAVNGTLDASSTTGKGGDIDVFGDRVGLFGNALVNANGATGGGSVRIGGDYLGTNAANAPQANRTFIGTDARVTANATQGGDGGRVIVWSNEYTGFFGSIQANGAGVGNGGFVETSSHDNLQAFGSVTASSVLGAAGTWLMDPSNVEITINTNTNPGAFVNPWVPTDDSSQISAVDIVTALNGNTSVQIQTNNGAGIQSGNITMATGASITSTGTATLTLIAAGNINITEAITGTGGGALSVVLGAVGSVTVAAAVNTNGGNFTIRGADATGATLATSAGSAVLSANITTGAGALSITATGAVNQTAGALVIGGTTSVTTGGAAITLTQAANDFGGAVSLRNTGANAVAITDTDDLILGTVSMTSGVAGTLNITSVGLTQAGATTITTGQGAVTINGGAGVITLTNANTFNGVLSLANSGVNNDVSITDINRLRLGVSSIGQDLNIIATNNISVESAITVGRDINITAVPIGGGPAINVELGVENFTLFSVNNDDFANMTAGRNLNITATGFMTVDGVLLGGNIVGITTLTASGIVSVPPFPIGVTFSGASSNFNNALTVASIATIAGVNITTAGNMTFSNTVTLTTAAVSLNSSGGDILFSNTLTGGSQNLTIAAGTAAGTTTFTGVVSGMGTGTGAAITLASTGLVDFQNTVGGASGIVSTNAAGSTRFQQDVTLTNGDTASTFAGAVTFDGMNWSGFNGLTVSGATTLTSGDVTLLSNGAGINFGGIITDVGLFNLTLNAGTTGAIAATGVNALGLIDINNLTITNAASATFAGNVQVNDLITTANPYTVTMTGATNTFAQNVAFLNSGRVTMGDVAGTDTFLFNGSMNFTNNAPSSIGGFIRSPGQVLDFGTGGVTLIGNTTVDSTNVGGTPAGVGINFGSTIDGAFGLIVNAGIADVTFNNNVGTGTALANLTVTSGDLTTHFLGNVTTVGDQTYNGGAQMDIATVVFTASDTNGDITFNGAVRSGTGVENMTVLAGGNVTFNNTVGGTDTTTQFANLTVDCGNDLGETITFGTAAATVRADAVNLNTNTLLATPATIATIVARSNISFANTTFAMGQNEKLTSLGGIRINGLTGLTSNATSVTLGDVNAVGNLRVTSPSIALLARASGPITTNTGGTITDAMVDYIVGGQVFFSTTPVMSGSGSQATFSNPTGNVDGSGTLGNFAQSLYMVPINVALLTGTTGQILDLSTSGSGGFGNPALIIPQPIPLLPPVGLLGNSDTLDQDSADDSTNGNSKNTGKLTNSNDNKTASDKPAVSAVVPVASR